MAADAFIFCTKQVTFEVDKFVNIYEKFKIEHLVFSIHLQLIEKTKCSILNNGKVVKNINTKFSLVVNHYVNHFLLDLKPPGASKFVLLPKLAKLQMGMCPVRFLRYSCFISEIIPLSLVH